jgi:GTPase SAR1 family protein
MVGAEKSGKSCLIKRYCEKRFVSKYMPTIGIDYGATKIYVDKESKKKFDVTLNFVTLDYVTLNFVTLY